MTTQAKKTTLLKLLKVLTVFVIYAAIGGLFFLIFHLSGLTLTDLTVYLDSIGIWAYVLFVLIQVFTNVVLFIIPGQTLQFIALGLTLFTPLETFITVLTGMVIASLINFLIGRFLGDRFVVKIIGQDTYNQYQSRLASKAYVYYPVMMLLPFFPDDEITLLVGLSKMNVFYFLITTVATRAVGVAVFTFIPGQIVFSYQNTLEFVLLIIGMSYIVILLFYLIYQFEKVIARFIH